MLVIFLFGVIKWHFGQFGGKNRLTKMLILYVQIINFKAFFYISSRSRLFTIKICEKDWGIKVQYMKIWVTCSGICTFSSKFLYANISSKKTSYNNSLIRCTEIEECIFRIKNTKKQYVTVLFYEWHHILYPYPLIYRREKWVRNSKNDKSNWSSHLTFLLQNIWCLIDSHWKKLSLCNDQCSAVRMSGRPSVRM